MLQIKDVRKQYRTGPLVQTALDGISLNLRDNEFVAVLGPSGSGKTTLLNIVGGLDRYDSGDLVIDGVSTKRYRDRDWDAYRNHRVGFVFQSYNLIPHQTILSNVELALTIGGVKRGERRRRAAEALEKVGLGDQLHKRPNQMSGGQMQRVAIARALVNDPAILLADEPTGALDSETGLQVMALLREVAKDRLVVMVTHNAELTETYATRTVRLKDGRIVDDTNPYVPETETEASHRSPGKASMSFLTALSLSFNNLRTKKGRTLLTAFAGSIGIIGIALILSLSTGVNRYITDTQKDTMTSYPITIEAESFDFGKLMTTGEKQAKDGDRAHPDDAVYPNGKELEMTAALHSSMAENNLRAFKRYLDDPASPIHDAIGEHGIIYGYSPAFKVYTTEPGGRLIRADGSTFQDESRAPQGLRQGMQPPSGMALTMGPAAGAADGTKYFGELMPAADGSLISPILTDNYEVVYGRAPKAYNELWLVLNKNNEVPATALYELGFLPAKDYEAILERVRKGKDADIPDKPLDYAKVTEKTFRLFPDSDFYQKTKNGLFAPTPAGAADVEKRLSEGIELKIVGVIRPLPNAEHLPLRKPLGYTRALTDYLMKKTAESPVVEAQEKDKTVNVLTGKPFADEIGTSYQANLKRFGVMDEADPTSISLYADSFEAKDRITDAIKAYNDKAPEKDKIVYTDYVGLLMSSVTAMINVVSYVLIAFVGVSLVVSSIMIGIITYISVLERTKEIGILRAIGASKANISQVFNAETFIIGLCSGLLGIGISSALLIPGNQIIHAVAGNANVNAYLPPVAALVLLALAVLLTLLGGLIPSRMAADKDPVIALRTE